MQPSLTVTLTANGDLAVNLGTRMVTVSCTADGAAALRRILVARQQPAPPALGTESAPVQSMVDAWIKQHGDPRVPPELRDLDLDL